jgi:hypothetical protein
MPADLLLVHFTRGHAKFFIQFSSVQAQTLQVHNSLNSQPFPMKKIAEFTGTLVLRSKYTSLANTALPAATLIFPQPGVQEIPDVEHIPRVIKINYRTPKHVPAVYCHSLK